MIFLLIINLNTPIKHSINITAMDMIFLNTVKNLTNKYNPFLIKPLSINQSKIKTNNKIKIPAKYLLITQS